MVCSRTSRSPAWFSRGRAVFEPEQVEGFERLPQPRRLDRRQSMVRVMQEWQLGPELGPDGIEDGGDMSEISRCVPRLFDREILAACRLVVVPLAFRRTSDAVDRSAAGNARLDSDRAIAGREVLVDRIEQRGQVGSTRVAIGQKTGARGSAEQLVQGLPRDLRLDVPQCLVDGGDGRHRDRSSSPVATAIEVLPGVLDAVGIAGQEERADVVSEIRGDGELTAIERRVAEPFDAVRRREAQRHEVATRARDDHVGSFDRAGQRCSSKAAGRRPAPCDDTRGPSGASGEKRDGQARPVRFE